MASQITSSNPEVLQPGWSSLSGKVLEGGFELQEILEADDAQARFKVRVLGDRELDCVALFFRLSGADAKAQVQLWTMTRQLRHPNVSAPLGTGQLTVDEITAVYVVVRRADESLDAVLSERPLTIAEAGEALESTARALEVLHLNDLVYGCLAPSRVLAVGEAIKLPAECIRATHVKPSIRVFSPAYLAPESQGENVTPQADLWCLGATLFEALTQKTWTEESREETGALPEPFASIALRCLHTDPEGRANLGEVMALFRGELKPVPRVRAAVAGTSTEIIVPQAQLETSREALPLESPKPAQELPKKASEPMIALSSVAQEAVPVTDSLLAAKSENITPPLSPLGTVRPTANKAAGAAPVAPRKPAFDEAITQRPTRLQGGQEAPEEPTSRLWLWAGIALVVVLGLVWVLRPKASAGRPGPSVSSTNANHDEAPAKPLPATKNGRGDNAWEARTIEPDGSTLRTAPAPPAKSATTPAKAVGNSRVESGSAVASASGPAVWRVVTYTYSRKEDAEKRVQAINAKHGNLQAEVFSPAASGEGPFLVAVGGRMTREEAAQLRRKAIAAGLPHDSYIQNYSR